MAKSSEKLAASLEALQKLQDQNIVAIQSADLKRTHLEILVKEGFLKSVLRGWYIPARPDEAPGETTAWFASFWKFCAGYLNTRFEKKWCLSPEQSLQLHSGNKNVPKQLLVRAPKAGNRVTKLLHGTSLFELRSAMPEEYNITMNNDGIHLLSLSDSLIQCADDFFIQHPTDARAALAMIRDASEILPLLLDGGHSVVAGRLAGAFRNIGKDQIANEILQTMRAAYYKVWEKDPFEEQSPFPLVVREHSPYVNRIRLMWERMRSDIIPIFPPSPGLPQNTDAYKKQVEDTYVRDAYNSLSIEGYRVSEELIERVRSGQWAPLDNEKDRNHRDALAARGYWQAYQAVIKSLDKILKGKNAGTIANQDHNTWYREMLGPSVIAGILKASDLAGYRNHPVYIRGSKHIPPSADVVRDVLPVFFELLQKEEEASVRVVLGHFIFVFIHPYMDGNGRIGRFLMNAMLASGGYSWTVVPLQQRDEYMRTLEEASVEQNIVPFAQFLANLITKDNHSE